MSKIPELCDRIVSYNRELGRPIVDNLLPGISADEVRQQAAAADLIFPMSVVDLYGWRNGVDRGKGGSKNLFDRVGFFPLKDQVAAYKDIRDCRDDFRASWFPLFESETGDFWAIECTATPTDDGAIVLFDNEEADHPVIFESLAQALMSMTAVFQRGLYTVDDRKRLVADSSAYRTVLAELNPASAEVWKSGRR